MKLPDVAALLWRAYGAGEVTEAEAEELSGLIEARRAPVASEPQGSSRSRSGSRPRSHASLERRRRWAASGRLPPALAAHFTIAEQAVLALIAAEVTRRGDCRLAIGRVAAIAGVSETSVRNAVREARRLGLITVEERRQSAWRNDTNVVCIVSPEWTAWLRLARREKHVLEPLRAGRGGCKSANPTSTLSSSPVNSRGRKRQRLPEGRATRAPRPA